MDITTTTTGITGGRPDTIRTSSTAEAMEEEEGEDITVEVGAVMEDSEIGIRVAAAAREEDTRTMEIKEATGGIVTTMVAAEEEEEAVEEEEARHLATRPLFGAIKKEIAVIVD